MNCVLLLCNEADGKSVWSNNLSIYINVLHHIQSIMLRKKVYLKSCHLSATGCLRSVPTSFNIAEIFVHMAGTVSQKATIPLVSSACFNELFPQRLPRNDHLTFRWFVGGVLRYISPRSHYSLNMYRGSMKHFRNISRSDSWWVLLSAQVLFLWGILQNTFLEVTAGRVLVNLMFSIEPRSRKRLPNSSMYGFRG